MARYAVNLSNEEFLKKVNKIFKDEDDYYALIEYLEKDLSKVRFDGENSGWFKYDGEDLYAVESLIRTTPNGLKYIIAWAGGDWEMPVHYIIYFDGSKIRGYIPEQGNTFNVYTKTAFGSEEDSGIEITASDFEKLLKVFREKRSDLLKFSNPNLIEKMKQKFFEGFEEVDETDDELTEYDSDTSLEDCDLEDSDSEEEDDSEGIMAFGIYEINEILFENDIDNRIKLR